MEEFRTIQYEKKDGAVYITLNRPKSFNTFTEQMNQEMITAFKEADRDEKVRVIAITGEGRAFCAGEDLGGVDEKTNHETFLRKRYHPMMKTMKKTSKPVVALINGVAAGAGMSLALATDFRVMNEKAKFTSAFLNIGLIPDSAFIYYLPRIVGYAKAMEISILGKSIGSKEAYEIGMATEVYEEEEWKEKTEEFVQYIASLPTKSISLIKRYMLDGMNEPFEEVLTNEAQAQRIAGLSEDHKEGLRAFEDKRRPVFQGK